MEWSLETLTTLLILANIAAIIAIRVEINPEPKQVNIERSPWFWIFTTIGCFIALTPLSYMRPMGVDWIGFASLADSISELEDLFSLNLQLENGCIRQLSLC